MSVVKSTIRPMILVSEVDTYLTCILQSIVRKKAIMHKNVIILYLQKKTLLKGAA